MEKYNKSKETRKCPNCSEKHKIGYVTLSNETHHIAMYCPDKLKTVYIPFEHGLSIPSVLSSKAKKFNKQDQTAIYKYLVRRNKRSKVAKIKPYATV